MCEYIPKRIRKMFHKKSNHLSFFVWLVLDRRFIEFWLRLNSLNIFGISLFCVTVLSLLLYRVLIIIDFDLFLWILSFFILRMFSSHMKVKGKSRSILFFTFGVRTFEFLIQLFLFSSFDYSFAFSLFHSLKLM